MPFDDDVRDREVVHHRPAMRIVITTFDGEHVETIDLPEVTFTRGEARVVSPEWLAMRDAERSDTDERPSAGTSGAT